MSEQESARAAPAPDTSADNASPDTDQADLDAKFKIFYLEITKPLVTFLLLQGAGLSDAADIAQDRMIRAYKRWRSIDYPRAWAYRVASRASIRNVSTVREDPVAETPELSPLLRATDIEQWEQQHDVIRTLAQLPPRQRQVMAWTMSGYTPAEIAEELGLTSEAVRASLMKARRTLISWLDGREGSK